MARKRILQGIDSFKKLIDNNGYYVDKTLFVKDLIDIPDQIVLITRPRRFGKTLNMSMLRYFFENKECRRYMQEDKDVSYLFEDLKIFNNGDKYRKEQGKYPVIYLTLKNAKQLKWKPTFINLKKTIADEYKRHRYILYKDILNESEKETYNNIMNLKADEYDYTDVIKNLSEYLKRYFRENVMVIIDEYDTPIQAGYINGYFEEVIEFMKSVLIKGFKDNYALKQGVLMGIMKVAKESIFSDFNNPLVCTVLSEDFKDRFGFTEEEVEEIAKYFNLENKLEDIRVWYNGYIFGNDTVIYNPWSIVSYMRTPKNGLKPYWVNTSHNRVIKEVMQLDKVEGKRTVEALIKGEEVKKEIAENVVYQNIKNNPNAAWSFLLHAGYLKVSSKQAERNRIYYNLEIPNLEVQRIYEDMIINYFKEDTRTAADVEMMVNSLLDNDIDTFEIILSELYLKEVSYNDTKNITRLKLSEQKEKYENFHHGFILGMLMLTAGEYEIYSNREYGLGRPDIVLVPKNKNKTTYIFEFKWESTKGTKSLEALVDSAIQQIIEKKYKQAVKAIHKADKIVCIGVGFKGKELKIKKKG